MQEPHFAESCSCRMGFGTPKKVSKKKDNQDGRRFDRLDPIQVKCSFRYNPRQHRNWRSLARPDLLIGESEKMEALNPSAQKQESDLVQRASSGDKEAFYLLVEPCERALFAAAMAILRNPDDAEEAAQEAVLKAFMNIGRFRGESKFSTWIMQICVNEARQKIRNARQYLYESIDEPECSEEGDYFPRDFADWREIPSEALQRKELQVALKRALDSLPEKYRVVLILRDIQHLSIEETAQVLGLSAANVKTRLLRARLQMRDALAPGLDGSWSFGRQEYAKVRAW